MDYKKLRNLALQHLKREQKWVRKNCRNVPRKVIAYSESGNGLCDMVVDHEITDKFDNDLLKMGADAMIAVSDQLITVYAETGEFPKQPEYEIIISGIDSSGNSITIQQTFYYNGKIKFDPMRVDAHVFRAGFIPFAPDPWLLAYTEKHVCDDDAECDPECKYKNLCLRYRNHTAA